MAKIGLVQTCGIGDIVIALPIAAAMARRGDSVCWPVDERFAPFLQRAAPFVNFLPVPRDVPSPEDYFIFAPQRALKALACDRIYILYSAMRSNAARLENKLLPGYLKFDEYKYAVTGVPFSEKWNLRLERDMDRERRLFDGLGVRRDYVCVHRIGTLAVATFEVPPAWRRDFDIVEIDERTDSPFDWIYTLEKAAKIVCVDSCFANLVEQLNLPNEKHLILRSPNPFTPVMKNGWTFLAPPTPPAEPT